MPSLKPLHIVQVGYDDHYFETGPAPSDSLHRQQGYAAILKARRPESSLSILALTTQQDATRLTLNGLNVIPVHVPRLRYLFRLWRALTSLHRERQIDVLSPQNVFAEGWAALLWGKIFGVPVVGQIHFDIFSPEAQHQHLGRGPKGWILNWLMFRYLPRFSSLRVVGNRIQRQLHMRGIHSARVIPIPVTMLETHNRTDLSKADSLKVLYVGRLVEQKNLFLWLDVAARVAGLEPAAVFEIIGSGPLEGPLRRYADSLGLRGKVVFSGPSPYADLPSKYSSASVFLLTSHYEGFGRVIAEALAHGLPVVATRVTGVEDIVEQEVSGFLHEPPDLDGMAASVLRLLQAPNLRTKMGGKGSESVRLRFAPRELAEAWVDFLIESAPESVGIPPLRPTWKRWKQLASPQFSLLRGLEYERIQGLTLTGRTLDIGGGARNSYYGLLNIRGSIESVNIDRGIQPSFVADLNHTLPVKGSAYDNIISLNTFEHIEQDTIAIREALRVLKPGGAFHIIVPFLYRVHGSPSDYHRHTAFWWQAYLEKLGVPPGNIRIEPLIWDPVSSGFAVAEYMRRLRSLRKKAIMLPAVLRNLVFRGWHRIPNQKTGISYAEYALGYYISGVK